MLWAFFVSFFMSFPRRRESSVGTKLNTIILELSLII